MEEVGYMTPTPKDMYHLFDSGSVLIPVRSAPWSFRICVMTVMLKYLMMLWRKKKKSTSIW